MMTTKSLGIVFPGQGSQSVGMTKDIAEQFPQVQAVFSEASQILNYDLWKLVIDGPAEELDKTVHTQPALLTASYALWQILKTKKNLQPALMAGHSLGEYTALVCANSIAFKDAVRLVAARGQYMQDAVPVGEGALAAVIGIDDAIVQSVCEKAKINAEVLSLVNFNCPGQVVIGGHIAAVQRALVLAKEAGAKIAKLLPVSAPSHCILMKSAAARLAQLLEQIPIQPPAIPVINNVDVMVYNSSEAIRDGLTRQLYMPVRWTDTIRAFATAGISNIIECGPGKVLSGLNKRIAPEMQLANTADQASVQILLEETIQNS
jgi:[acyl-carrier-protein] S-malonyltransferase